MSNTKETAAAVDSAAEGAAASVPTPLTHITDAKQIDALKKAIANGGKADIRVVYTDAEAAAAAWEKASALAATMGLAVVSMPDSINAAGPDGTTITVNPFDGNRVAIAGLMQRVTMPDKKEKNAVTALVRFPMPTLESFAENASDWLDKIVEKEAAHVAFRRLRDNESVEELTASMSQVPTNAADFAASYRSGGGLDTDAFDEMWPRFRQFLLNQYPALDGVLPSKAEVIKCIRDAEYARTTQEVLESKQLFKFIGLQMVAAAPGWTDEKDGTPADVDPAAIQSWIDNRDTPIYSIRTIDPDKLADLSFDIGV